MRGLLFWVNLARKDKGAEPSAQLLPPQDVPVRHDRDATVRVLVGEGSPAELGTPALILDVELPTGGGVLSLVPPGFNAYAAYGQNSSVGKILEIHQEPPGRIHVVLIRQTVGF
jgi:redox-sensitive bicupin YhaK (pirin superfamily)